MLRTELQALVRPGERAIFFDERLYWISERYPNWPVLNTDVQTTYFVERHSADLLLALDDPRLTLVEFDPGVSTFADPDFLNRLTSRSFLRAFQCRLEARFTRHDQLIRSLILWTPRIDRDRSGFDSACSSI